MSAWKEEHQRGFDVELQLRPLVSPGFRDDQLDEESKEADYSPNLGMRPDTLLVKNS